MDFIFGTFATDDLKLFHHRAARRGVQHDYALTPVDPAPGQPVMITVRIGTDRSVDHVVCYYTLDGSEPRGARGVAQGGHALRLRKLGIEWDINAWGYVEQWVGEIPPQPADTVVRYRIGAWAGAGDSAGAERFADTPVVRDLAERAAAAFFKGQDPPPDPPPDPHGQVFGYHVDQLTPPDWARRAVIYQVFVDRFYPGDGRAWQQPADLMGFFGGTLWGVRDKLDYIEQLGATCIWLSPIFPSPTHHGYDATDYTAVEPRLGGPDALHALVEAAHARGIRILLDMACNHLSDRHPLFQAARDDPASEHRDWFTFDDSEIGYRAFFGVKTMPEVNVAHPAARAWLIEAARFWLREFDVDGFRLDYANGPGPDFWSAFRAGCRAEKADCFLVGEIIDQPAAWRPYIGRLDGCLDFHVDEMLRRTFAQGRRDEADFWRFVERHNAYFAAAGNFIRPTFVDNHDMDRFIHLAGGDVARLRRAAEAQFALDQPPVIYYGTEVGLSQQHSRDEDGWGLEVSREPMLWGADQDADLLAFYRDRIAGWKARQL